MNSVAAIKNAAELLAEYCHPQKTYGWPLYDIDPAPNTLSGVDLTAPALLSYPIRGQYLNEMGAAGSLYFNLVEAMRHFLKAAPQTFWEIDHERIKQMAKRKRGAPVPDDAWGRLTECLDLANGCPGLSSVFVTKVLHRKRPDLVPINDSHLRRFYSNKKGYSALFSAVHKDVSVHRELLENLASSINHPDVSLSPLRVLDIVIWMDKRASGTTG